MTATIKTGGPLDNIEVSGSTIVGVIMAAAVTFVGWIIRVSAKQMLKSFEDSLERHAKAIDKNTGAIERMQIHLAEIDARLTVIEKD